MEFIIVFTISAFVISVDLAIHKIMG